MKKFRVTVSTNLVGSKVWHDFEVEDDATPEEIEREAREVMFELIEWNYEEVK